MFILATFRILSFRTLPFIPQKKSASNFPQITPWQLSAFRNPHSAKYPFPSSQCDVMMSSADRIYTRQFINILWNFVYISIFGFIGIWSFDGELLWLYTDDSCLWKFSNVFWIKLTSCDAYDCCELHNVVIFALNLKFGHVIFTVSFAVIANFVYFICDLFLRLLPTAAPLQWHCCSTAALSTC